MKIQRTIPPVANHILFKDLLHGLAGIFNGKKYIKKFENEIKNYFDVRHVFLVSSGKAALTLILMALKSLSPSRGEVLIPAYTCFSVPSSIVKAGLKVSLCDMDLSTLDFNYKLLKEAINENTLCVIPNHLFGLPSNMDSLNSLCKNKGIFIVEDAAQAMGGTYKGKMLGTIGDVGFFSLGRGKNITCGSGGIIVTNSDQIAGAIARYYSNLVYPGITEDLKEFLQVVFMSIFIHPALFWFPLRLPFLKLGQTIFYRDFPVTRFSGMKAGLLWKWQDRLELSNQIRISTGIYFTERLQFKISRYNSIPYPRLPIIVNSRDIRDRIYCKSCERGLGIGLMYPTPINEIEEIKNEFSDKVFPVAGKIAGRLITIPTHQFLSEKDKKAICKLCEEELIQESSMATHLSGETTYEAYRYH